MRERLVGRLTDPYLQSYNFGSLGRNYHAIGQIERATKLYSKALGIARERGDRRLESIWLGNLGRTYPNSRQIEEAVKLYVTVQLVQAFSFCQ
jgi:tetratricopeptide (TPR) repeat protein